MKPFSIDKLSIGNLSTTVAADELCVVLSPFGSQSAGLEELIRKAYSSLQRKTHYLTVYTGFFGGSERPWCAPVFTKEGRNALERRWVFHDWAKSLQTMFANKKLCVFMDDGCTTEDIVRVEDLITIFAGPLYTSSKWTDARIFASDPDAVTREDRQHKLRFEHQLEYRRWVNENPDTLTSIEIGDRLRDFANSNDCAFMTLEESALQDEGMNLLLGVGQGAKRSPPRLHIISKNLSPKTKPIALVGKGITFDTGGINLKPHESFVNCMKNDMGGAALTAQLFMGLIRGGFNKPIVLAIPACENAIDSRSMKPGAIIKSRKGKSVIIEHTDAEGRLILADAMSYVWDKFAPSHMYTAATLTTASLRQFTNFFTPIHFASDSFKHKITQAADKFGEAFTFWDDFLPFLNGNKINAADLTNMGRMPSHASMGGGSNVAAHFLREFADGPYTHIDIFNSIWNWSGDYPGAHYGCTGAVFNTLWQTLAQE